MKLVVALLVDYPADRAAINARHQSLREGCRTHPEEHLRGKARPPPVDQAPFLCAIAVIPVLGVQMPAGKATSFMCRSQPASS